MAAKRLRIAFWHPTAVFMKGACRAIVMDALAQLVYMSTHWVPAIRGMLKAENSNGITLLHTVLKYFVNLLQLQLRSLEIERLLDMLLKAVPYIYDSLEGMAPWIAFGAQVVTAKRMVERRPLLSAPQ